MTSEEAISFLTAIRRNRYARDSLTIEEARLLIELVQGGDLIHADEIVDRLRCDADLGLEPPRGIALTMEPAQ